MTLVDPITNQKFNLTDLLPYELECSHCYTISSINIILSQSSRKCQLCPYEVSSEYVPRVSCKALMTLQNETQGTAITAISNPNKNKGNSQKFFKYWNKETVEMTNALKTQVYSNASPICLKETKCNDSLVTVQRENPSLLKQIVIKKSAIVTGITGQDGAYLSRFLLDKGYHVYGGYRRTSSESFWRIEELGIRNHPNFILTELDITDQGSILKALKKAQPDEFYNLAAQSFVGVSFTQPHATLEATGAAVLKILESIMIHDKRIKFYQASTSELYGKVQQIPQSETTPFYPRSPYAIAKQFAHWTTVNFRESYGMHAACGILFNHESPLRGHEFVTRKITQAVAKIENGKQEVLELGNLDAKRDWGFAGDYVEAMFLILNHSSAEDFVISTGRTETVRFFVEKAFGYAGIEIEWHGKGNQEYGIDKTTKETVVKVNPEMYRPAEVDLLVGDSTKVKKVLGWEPKTKLEELIKMMVEEDLKRHS